jgi:multiple antibiotic resistance protein
MSNEIGFATAVIASVFAICDPLGTLPFFVALTDGFSPQDRRLVRNRSVLVLGVVLTVFAIAGRFLFAAFGFTLEAFEIAGGILLFIIGYEMLAGEITRTKMTEQDRQDALSRRDEISIVPLGIPLLAGPGAISTVMIYEGTAGSNPVELFATFIAIAITAGATWVVFYYGDQIFRRMGRVGVMAVSRVMGLLLAAVGVQFILNGITNLLPHL